MLTGSGGLTLKSGFYAVFIDAGYLFAASSKLSNGELLPRENIEIDVSKIIEEIKNNFPLRYEINFLRTYYYDGVRNSGLNDIQQKIARLDFVKFRAGSINVQGKQKQVDSLIITDLIELARNKSITDAILLAGDADFKVGITIAQNFGVRVHLVGIETDYEKPSLEILNEVDTYKIFTKETIDKYIKLIPNKLHSIAVNFAKSRNKMETEHIFQYMEKHNGEYPPQLDASLLSYAWSDIGKSLTDEEKRILRKAFKNAIKKDKRKL